MSLEKLKRPVVFFDLETTGLSVELDRIIEIALLKIFPDEKTVRLTQRFDPGIKIPVESVEIHGIRNSDLIGQPHFYDKAGELFELFADCDLGGYAIRRMDIPMLAKEFDRAGYHFTIEGRRIVDPGNIFRQKEKRDLSAAYRFYCQKELVGAHSAQADIEATYEVFLAQLKHYEDLPKNMEGLHKFCYSPDPGQVDPEGRFIWRDAQAFFNFGKHRYKSLAEVIRKDTDYLDWIINKGGFSAEVVEICQQAKRGILPKKSAKDEKL